MTTDTLTRAMTTAAVLLVAAIAAIVSYVHIRQLALAHGGDSLTAALLPLLIDGTVAAMSGFMLTAARDEARNSIPWLARFMLVLSVGATLAANTAFGAAFGLTGALLWTLPAVMFVGCVEVSVLMVRKTRPAMVSAPEVAPVRAAVSDPVDEHPQSPQSDSAAHDKTGTEEDVSGHPVSIKPATMTVREQAAAAEVPERLTVAEQAALLGRSPRQVARYRVDGSIGRRLAMVSGNGSGHG